MNEKKENRFYLQKVEPHHHLVVWDYRAIVVFNDRNYTFLNFSSLHGFLSLKISLIILLFIIFVDFVILNYRNDIFFLNF